MCSKLCVDGIFFSQREEAEISIEYVIIININYFGKLSLSSIKWGRQPGNTEGAEQLISSGYTQDTRLQGGDIFSYTHVFNDECLDMRRQSCDVAFHYGYNQTIRFQSLQFGQIFLVQSLQRVSSVNL